LNLFDPRAAPLQHRDDDRDEQLQVRHFSPFFPHLAAAPCLAISCLLFNGALIALVNNNVNVRFASIEARLEILTGKMAELTDRVTRL
jgi:hypothetical protein